MDTNVFARGARFAVRRLEAVLSIFRMLSSFSDTPGFTSRFRITAAGAPRSNTQLEME